MALAFPDVRPDLFTVPAFHVGGATLGPFAVRWYALAYIAGILLGWRYAISLVKTPRLWGGRTPTATSLQIDDLILWVTIGVIVGGRIGYILFYMLPVADSRIALFADPWEALRVWHGGMSFHGGALGVVVALVLFAARQKIPVLRLADLAAACTPIGLFFGRLANFINGELWGRPTHLPWGIVFCGPTIASGPGGACVAGLEPRHPSQLYEAALEGVVLFLILRWATHRAGWLQRNGAVTGLFLLGYGLFRISLEHVRMPDEGLRNLPLGLTMGMILSAPMVLVGLLLIWRGLARAPAAASLADAP
jgi:phosphatidylglycerol:prolipoprotein diacylglycerol transferase